MTQQNKAARFHAPRSALAADDTANAEIITTAPHPFFVVQKHRFVAASDLRLSDRFRLASGQEAVLTGVREENAQSGATFTTYNLEVAEFHTYFAGKHGVWVHNSSKPCEVFLSIMERVRKGTAAKNGIVADWEVMQYTLQTKIKGLLGPQRVRVDMTDQFLEELYERLAETYNNAGTGRNGGKLHSPPSYVYKTWDKTPSPHIAHMKAKGLEGNHWWPKFLDGADDDGQVFALSTPYAHTQGGTATGRSFHARLYKFLIDELIGSGQYNNAVKARAIDTFKYQRTLPAQKRTLTPVLRRDHAPQNAEFCRERNTMRVDNVKTLIQQADLGEATAEIERLPLLSIRILPQSTDEPLQIGGSKIGGKPNLLPSVSWPEVVDRQDCFNYEIIAGPMAFLIQINLSDLSLSEDIKDLPTSGLLSFFATPWVPALGYGDHEDCCRVLYQDCSNNDFIHAEIPPHKPAFEYDTYGIDGFLFKEGSLEFRYEMTLPEGDALRVQNWARKLSDVQRERYFEVVEKMGVSKYADKFIHRLLGHPQLVQNDMSVLLKQTIDTEWRLLLQLDTEPSLGLEWQAWGRGYFWIPSEDLKRHDFSRVYCIVQCS